MNFSERQAGSRKNCDQVKVICEEHMDHRRLNGPKTEQRWQVKCFLQSKATRWAMRRWNISLVFGAGMCRLSCQSINQSWSKCFTTYILFFHHYPFWVESLEVPYSSTALGSQLVKAASQWAVQSQGGQERWRCWWRVRPALWDHYSLV